MGGLSQILSHFTTVYFLSSDQSGTAPHSLVTFCSPAYIFCILLMYVLFRTYVHMYVCMPVSYSDPLPHLWDTGEHNVYTRMSLPPFSNNPCHPLSSPAPFIRSSVDIHFWHFSAIRKIINFQSLMPYSFFSWQICLVSTIFTGPPDNKEDLKALFRHTYSGWGWEWVVELNFFVNESEMPTGATTKQSRRGNKLCKITSSKGWMQTRKTSRMGRDKGLLLLVQWKGTINLWEKGHFSGHCHSLRVSWLYACHVTKSAAQLSFGLEDAACCVSVGWDYPWGSRADPKASVKSLSETCENCRLHVSTRRKCCCPLSLLSLFWPFHSPSFPLTSSLIMRSHLSPSPSWL